MNRSNIPWLVNADGTKGYTWSPTTGCSPASAGCLNCWARAYHVRYRGGDFSVKLHTEKLDEPLRRRKPSTIGVCLMGDLFHLSVTAMFIGRVFAYMAAAPRHTFIVLTKRPERMRDLLHPEVVGPLKGEASQSLWELTRPTGRAFDFSGPTWPLPNLWLGVSVEDQRTADERIPILLDTPAAHRWVSLEPQIGPVDFRDWLDDTEDSGGDFSMPHPCDRIDWVVQGCESGPRRRQFDVSWARSVRDQCAAARVPYYLKQVQEEFDRPGEPGRRVVNKPTLDGRQHLDLPFVVAHQEVNRGRKP